MIKQSVLLRMDFFFYSIFERRIRMLVLSLSDVLAAAAVSLMVTIFINGIINVRKSLANVYAIISAMKDGASDVTEKCYVIFPIKDLDFKGEKISRGNRVRIKTKTDVDIEGIFIGGNSQNMVCIKTSKHVIAHELKNISEIIKLS
ncbi:MAG TPA: hypothetical protein DCG28_02630 [Lachnospiraceae bacterium]|nr:hypothetical protein [Lachnospiraceae bacterium]